MTRKKLLPRVVWAITNLQGWCRGIESRKRFRRHKDLVTKIQRRWRGAMTRKKLLAMLDQYKWRKKEISNYFLPKTRQERMVAKQKFAAQYGRKDVAYKQTAATLSELRNTIVDSSGTDTLEDVGRVRWSTSRTCKRCRRPAASRTRPWCSSRKTGAWSSRVKISAAPRTPHSRT